MSHCSQIEIASEERQEPVFNQLNWHLESNPWEVTSSVARIAFLHCAMATRGQFDTVRYNKVCLECGFGACSGCSRTMCSLLNTPHCAREFTCAIPPPTPNLNISSFCFTQRRNATVSEANHYLICTNSACEQRSQEHHVAESLVLVLRHRVFYNCILHYV